MALSLQTPLNEEELVELDTYLLADEETRLPVDEAHGYISGLIAGHAPVTEQIWLEAVRGESDKLEADAQERIDLLLLRMQHDIAATLGIGKSFEPMIVETEEDGEIFEAYEGWCFGFMQAVVADLPRWETMPKNEQDLLGAIARLSLLYVEESLEIDDEEYEMLVELLPGAVVGLYSYWNSAEG